MKHKQLLSSKILAKTTLVPTMLSKDSPSGETLATPYVRDNELLQCEVNIHYINDIIHLRMDLSRSRYQRPAIRKFFINIGKSKEILKKVNANHYRHKKVMTQVQHLQVVADFWMELQFQYFNSVSVLVTALVLSQNKILPSKNCFNCTIVPMDPSRRLTRQVGTGFQH